MSDDRDSNAGAREPTAEDPLVIALSGTPGTGKTTASARLDRHVIDLNDRIDGANLAHDHDRRRDSQIVDPGTLRAWFEDTRPTIESDVVVVESLLAHHLPADRVIVLRCDPRELEDRLEGREDGASVRENARSEALDVVLAEAVDRHGRDRVFEIDTTDRSPAETAAAIEAVIHGDRDPGVGTVEFTDYLEP